MRFADFRAENRDTCKLNRLCIQIATHSLVAEHELALIPYQIALGTAIESRSTSSHSSFTNG